MLAGVSRRETLKAVCFRLVGEGQPSLACDSWWVRRKQWYGIRCYRSGAADGYSDGALVVSILLAEEQRLTSSDDGAVNQASRSKAARGGHSKQCKPYLSSPTQYTQYTICRYGQIGGKDIYGDDLESRLQAWSAN